MYVLDRIASLGERVWTYLRTNPLEVIVELAVIWIGVYIIVRFVHGTRAAGALKGVLLIFLVVTIVARVVGGGDSYQRLGFLYDKLLAILAVGLVVIFQPELRRAVIRVGEASLFRTATSDETRVVEAVVEACAYLSKARFGGLIVVERQTRLEGLAEGGTRLSAEVSARLLQTIFYPGSPLHDLAVIIRGATVLRAEVQLPLADPEDMPNPSFGSRHRAAVGVTKECDAIAVVVSEETGLIRIAERGRLTGGLTPEELRSELRRRLARDASGRARPRAETPA